MKESFTLGMWSPECNIISLVLITRLIGSTSVTLNCNNWDKILLCALLLAQKLWDDTPLANVDFPAIWQNVYPNETIDLKVVNSMEKLFLIQLHYDVHVSRSTYTQFYFELRDLSEQAFPLEPLSEEAVSALFTRVASFVSCAAELALWSATAGKKSRSPRCPLAQPADFVKRQVRSCFSACATLPLTECSLS